MLNEIELIADKVFRDGLEILFSFPNKFFFKIQSEKFI